MDFGGERLSNVCTSKVKVMMCKRGPKQAVLTLTRHTIKVQGPSSGARSKSTGANMQWIHQIQILDLKAAPKVHLKSCCTRFIIILITSDLSSAGECCFISCKREYQHEMVKNTSESVKRQKNDN